MKTHVTQNYLQGEPARAQRFHHVDGGLFNQVAVLVESLQ